MTYLSDESVRSGQPYPITDVDGRAPRTLADFRGDVCLTLIRDGDAIQMLGAGCDAANGLRFHQKNPGPDGKDVRVWAIAEVADGSFVASPAAAF